MKIPGIYEDADMFAVYARLAARRSKQIKFSKFVQWIVALWKDERGL